MTKRQLITWLEECGAPDDAVVLVPKDDRGDGDLEDCVEPVVIDDAIKDRRLRAFAWGKTLKQKSVVVIR